MMECIIDSYTAKVVCQQCKRVIDPELLWS